MDQYIKPEHTISDKSFTPNIVKGTGNTLHASNNKKFLDLASGVWNASIGYDTLQEQLTTSLTELISNGAFYLDIRRMTHPLLNTYASKLLDFVNTTKRTSFTCLYYSTSGSGANELALKLVRKVSSKSKIVSFDTSYHGTHFATMFLSGMDKKLVKFYNWNNEHFMYVSAPNDIDTLNNIITFLKTNHHLIGAFFIEPLLASAGTTVIDTSYLDKIISCCQKYNIIVVFDEVATGFFKTGKKFLFHELNHEPDILILSKSINNGFLPFSTVLISSDIKKKLRHQYNDHFSTQDGNLLAIKSAEITLDYYSKNISKIEDNVKKINHVILKSLQETKLQYSGKGVFHSIYINNETVTNMVAQHLATLGIIVSTFFFTGNHNDLSGITIACPLTIEIQRLEQALKEIKNTIFKYTYLTI